MASTSLMPSANDLLYSSVGAALVVPVLLIGVVTNFRLALLFGSIAIGILISSAVFNQLPWTPYTYASAFIIATTVCLIWLIQRLIETVRERNRQLATYLTQSDDLAAERERIRLAREIHDSIGHVLMTVNMQIEAALAHLEQDLPKTQAALITAQGYTKDAATEVRRSIASLRATKQDIRPLTEIIAALADDMQTSQLEIVTQVRGVSRAVTPQITFAVTRIVQEALTNVQKHAQATQVMVTLDYSTAAKLQLLVQDNGIGAAAAGTGYGLIGIRERAQALGGTAITQTCAGAGFTLIVEIPT